jgi:hypothetical protein
MTAKTNNRLQLRVERPGLPGGHVLLLDLAVDAATGRLNGSAQIDQAVAPPGNSISITPVGGYIRPLGLGQNLRLLAVIGQYNQPIVPPLIGPGGNFDVVDFTASLVLQSDGSGGGMFSFGSMAQGSVWGTTIVDCTVASTAPAAAGQAAKRL